MSNIHDSAIVDKNAVIDSSVIIGPYCVIGPNVQIQKNTILKSNVIIEGYTEIGKNCSIYPFAVLGNPPQDLKYKGEMSKLIIGNNNVIREHATMNPGTEGGGLVTKIGNNCLIMIGAQVAHDCLLGDNIILANNASLAGHVKVDDFAILGGLSGVHQFVRIGSHAMVGGLSALESDVIPYGSVIGNRAYLSGLNIIGLKRRGFNRKQIHDLRTAFRLIFSIEGTAFERLKDAIKIYKKNRVVMDIVKFIKNKSSSRAICQPKQKNNV